MEYKSERLVEYTPRPYQIELYNAAKERNTIVCLGTGTGKTFIAILLMKDPKFAEQLKGHFSTAKRTVFLVPTRPLVKQQAAEIRRHFDVNVGEYTGDKNVDFWDKSQWEAELVKNEVIVMTPQIFLDMLNHDFIKFNKVNLLIIDEVHWGARKKGKKESGHPYKQIMNIYNSFKTANYCLPRVLGLSASLINSSIKSELFSEAILDLEKTYSSVCNTSNVAQMCGTNPEEVVWNYSNQSSSPSLSAKHVVIALQKFINYFKQIMKTNDPNESIPLSGSRLKKCLTNIRNMLTDSQENAVKDPQTQQEYPNTMTWMGVWCANVATDIYIEEIGHYMELYRNLNPNYSELLDIVIKFMKMIKNVFEPELRLPNCVYNTASPKMHRLLDLLIKYKPNYGKECQLCGIVFVNQRSVAKVLTDWLINLKTINPLEYSFLNVGWVVGHSARPGFESLVASFTDRKQQQTIQKFRDKELNLLIATSVLEEGLDVRQCNVIIRFDKPKTFREYLQSKGRARAEGAYYYMMTSNEDSAKFQSTLKNFREMEEKVKNLNNKNNTLNGMSLNSENSDEENNDSSDEEEEYKNVSGDARVTTRSAIALLYRYCQKLPSDSFTKLIPNFEIKEELNKFRCSIRMPVNSPIKHIIYGEYRKKKSGAKKNAALEACKQLYEFGELDSNFLPISKEQFIEKYFESLGFIDYNNNNESTAQKEGTRNRNQIYNKRLAHVFSKSDIQSNCYYLHHISIDYPFVRSLNSDLITFGAISSKPISNSCTFPVFVKSGRIEVDFKPLNVIQINSQQKELIEKFHSFTFSEVLRLESSELGFCPKGSQYSLLIVPLKNETQINWNFIQFIYEQKHIQVEPVSVNDRLTFTFNRELYEDCVFYPWYRSELNPEFYDAIQITDLSVKSKFNENNGFETFEHFYREKYNTEICNKSQPLIEGKLVQKLAQINWFTIKRKTAKMLDKKEFFVPELIAIHPFPSSLWRQALCLPAILYRLNCLFLAEELRDRIHLETDPRIGERMPFNNKLKLDSQISFEDIEMSAEKRLHPNDECDDDCDGHPFDFGLESDDYLDLLNKPLKKKQRSVYPIRIVADTRRSESAFGSTNLSSNIMNYNSYDCESKIMTFTNTLISQFKLLLQNSRLRSNSLNIDAIAVDQMDYETENALRNNYQPNYGESFPFIYSGDIEQSIREKYDAKVGDPIRGPTADLLLNALTLLNANDGFNLERLETIGDSFLKFVSTAYLYYSCPELDEGRLSYLRSIQICNCNLYHIGLQKNISDILVATKFYPKQNWLPPCYETSDENDCILITSEKLARCHHLISDKSIADSIEALIGAYLLSGGNKSALIFMEWLGLKVSPKPIDYNNIENNNDYDIWRWLPLPKSPIIEHLNKGEVDKGLRQDYDGCNLDKFETIIGYQFRDKAFLVQAFTHSSYYHNQITDCYQRLEFLGDSVLDYLITRHIFKDSTKFSPGEITDLRSALVNNSFFASIAVKFNFHKYLKVLSPDLFRAIEHFVKNFEMDRVKAIKNCFNILIEDEVCDLEEIEVPKALGDIFESVAGAIFLDNGLSLDGVWSVYYKMLKPEIDYFSENVPKMPIRELREKFPSVKFGDAQHVSGRKIRIVAKVNGKEYAGIGFNKKFAKTAAAKSALRALKSTKNN